jgi:hypothetical protein
VLAICSPGLSECLASNLSGAISGRGAGRAADAAMMSSVVPGSFPSSTESSPEAEAALLPNKSTHSPAPSALGVIPDGTWVAAPPLPQSHPSPSPPRADLETLSHAALVARCAAAEAQSSQYAYAAQALLAALALSPSANRLYAGVARRLLVDALTGLSSVASVGHCECSMPAGVTGEAPTVSLVRFDGLHSSMWNVEFKPASWWVSVAVVTKLGLHVRVRVSGMQLSGLVRCALSHDLSSVRIAFGSPPKPAIDLTVGIYISILGFLPVSSLHASIESEVRAQVEGFFERNLLNGNDMLFVLRRTEPDDDLDMLEALEAVQRSLSLSSSTI